MFRSWKENLVVNQTSLMAYCSVIKPFFFLQGIPVMIRIGAADRTVHPYNTRRMFRLLREQRTNVTYLELADKEHWWWDTYKTNDGGVVNDPVIREFAVSHAQNAGKYSTPTSKTMNHNYGMTPSDYCVGLFIRTWQWFVSWSFSLCCFLRQETLLHTVFLLPGILNGYCSNHNAGSNPVTD